MKKLIVLLFILLGRSSYSQEVNLPQYINYMGDNSFMISPAFAGIGTDFQIRLNGVSQWIGIKNAPDTQSIYLEKRIGDRFGAGLVIFNDKNGNTSQQGAKISLASHLTLSKFNDSFFSFALSYNFLSFKINTHNFSSQDQAVINNKQFNLSNFDVSFLYRFNHFSINLNISNILDKEEVNFTNNEPLKLRRYTGYASYIFTRITSNFEFEPSVLVEFLESDKRSRTDINLKARKKTGFGYFWAGVSYSFLNDQFLKPNSVAPLVGIKKDNFYVSYGFGIVTNNTQNYNIGTHMITLGLDFERRQSLARCTKKFYMF